MNPTADHSALSREERDLLIKIDTKLGRAVEDIGGLNNRIQEVSSSMNTFKETVENKITAATAPKANHADMVEWRKDSERVHDDHEKRMRRIERMLYIGL